MTPTGHEPTYEYETEITRLLVESLDEPGARGPTGGANALALTREAYLAASPRLRSGLRRAADLPAGKPPPESLLERLERVLGLAGLHRWAREHEAERLLALGSEGELSTWLLAPPFPVPARLLRAGLRHGLGSATPADHHLIDARLGRWLRRQTMAFQYEHDPRGLPAGLDVDELESRVRAELESNLGPIEGSMLHFVLGAISLDGYLNQGAFAQRRGIRDARHESEGDTGQLDGTRLTHREAYERIAHEVESLRTADVNGSGRTGRAYYEELAFVARQLVSDAVRFPLDAPGLGGRVAQALGEYVPSKAGGTLTLPSLSAEDGTAGELVADHIRAVGLLYAGWNVEELKLMAVLDRVVEVFMNGQLPVSTDNGGRALAAYYFDPSAEERLSEAARRMTYSRVLGVPGGEVSKEAPPNRSFNDLFMRFMAAVSEYDRQRRIGDVVGGRPRNDALSLTGEQVRKAGRDLAANASLYGYGGTYFVAERLAAQIERALKILSTPEILAAYGVQGPFQVIERVCASDLGGVVPNIVRAKTMAESGKEILDIVAANVPAWLGLSGNDLFVDPFDQGETPADISLEAQSRLVRAVEHWLTVNGIKDDQRMRLGEPELTAGAPTIPTATGDSGTGPAFDQLRQMISAGQAPTMDQLKAMLPDMGGLARL